jgi:hypothetical protein
MVRPVQSGHKHYLSSGMLRNGTVVPALVLGTRFAVRIARWNAADSLSAFSATTIRRTYVQGSPCRVIRGLKTERKQRSFSYRHCALSKKQAPC